MKQCPICQSLAFDDAKTCFGCLHEFADKEPLGALDAPDSPDAPPIVIDGDAPPAFLIQIRPERACSGLISWTCTVDLMPA